MQNLWSRAARSKCTCCCLLCLNSARNGLSRRATTAAGNRKVEFKDAIFVAYMTIFATGIVADRKRKDGKREDWDRKIAEAKEEVELLRKKNDDRLSDGRPLAAVVRKGIRIRAQVPGVRRLYSTAQAVAMHDVSPDPSMNDIIEEIEESTSLSRGSAASFNPVADDSSGSRALREIEKPACSSSDSTTQSNRVLDDAGDPRFVYNEARRRFVPNGIPADLRISSQLEGIDNVEQYHLVEKWIKSGVQPSLRLRAIRSFSVKRLALKLVLRPAIQHSYGRPESFHVGGYIPRTYLREAFEGTSAQSVQELLHELAETKRHIWLAKTGEADDTKLQEMLGDTSSRSEETDRNQRLELNIDLKDTFNDFHEGRIDLKTLLFKVATNLLRSPATPLTSTFEILVRGFTKAKQMDVVHAALESLRESRRGLSNGIISATLNFYARSKDLLSFDKYITWLTAKANTEICFVPWKTLSIGTREIAIPPKEEARILQTMIAGALKFDQPHRAEMWLAVLRRYGMADDPYVVTVFLKYYALTCDWRQGKVYLGKAWENLHSTTPEELASKHFIMARMSFWMLHLCLNCRQVKPYRQLLKYTSDKNLDSQFVERYKHSWQADVIIQDWRDQKLTRIERHDQAQDVERIQSSGLGIFDEESPSDGQKTDATDFVPRTQYIDLVDEKATKISQTAFQRTQHHDSQIMSKVPEGAILKPSAVGYVKEDLELEQAWLAPAISSEVASDKLHRDSQETNPKAKLTSSQGSTNLLERLVTTSDQSLADIPDPNRHRELQLRRLSVTDGLDEIIESTRHITSQIETFRSRTANLPHLKSIYTRSLELKPITKPDPTLDRQRHIESNTDSNVQTESLAVEQSSDQEGTAVDDPRIASQISASDVQTSQRLGMAVVPKIQVDSQSLPVEEHPNPDLKIRFHTVGFKTIRFLSVDFEALRPVLKDLGQDTPQPLRREDRDRATKKGRRRSKPASDSLASKPNKEVRTYRLKLDQNTKVPQTSRQLRDPPLEICRKVIVPNPKKGQDEKEPAKPPKELPSARALSDEASVPLPAFRLRTYPSFAPEEPLEIKKLVSWKSVNSPNHLVEPEQEFSRQPAWGE